MTTIEDLNGIIRARIDPEAMVFARRPSVFQVSLPVYMADGDGVSVFVKPRRDGRFTVTDMGMTLMRMSYAGNVSEKMERSIERLAESVGFSLKGGEIRCVVGSREVVAALFGLVQIETQAEPMMRERRQADRAMHDFRDAVVALLVELFGAQNVELGYHDKATDPEGVCKLDAIVHAARPLVVAAVASELAAERAVVNKLELAPRLRTTHHWIAVPRDIGSLPTRAQKRLNRHYWLAGDGLESGREVVTERLLEMAA